MEIYNTWRDMDCLVAIFSLFGLILGIIMYEHGVHMNKQPLDPKVYPDPLDDPRNSNCVS